MGFLTVAEEYGCLLCVKILDERNSSQPSLSLRATKNISLTLRSLCLRFESCDWDSLVELYIRSPLELGHGLRELTAFAG